MDNSRILYDAFNIYYNKGMEALQNNNYEIAKRNLYAASESILKLAKKSQGALKAERFKRAEELASLANKIELQQRSELNWGHSKKNSNCLVTKGAVGDHDSDDSHRCFTPTATRSSITIDDVAGLYEAKDAIRRLVIEPRKHPDLYRKFKKKQGGGILLYGVPGTGKTMLAQAIANEIDAKFFSVKCSDIVSKYFGEAEQNIKSLFDEARKYDHSIIFFDEFEAIGVSRDTDSQVMQRIVDELLEQMQGFDSNENNLLLIAATNRPWDIDSAFLRPGRFNNPIYVPLPDTDARRAIINQQLVDIPTADDLNTEEIVEITEGFNGADIGEFCERLKDCAILRSIENGIESAINSEDVKNTSGRVFSSVRNQDLEKMDNYKKNC